MYVKQIRKEITDTTSSEDLVVLKDGAMERIRFGVGISKSALGPLNIRSYLNCYLAGNTNVS